MSKGTAISSTRKLSSFLFSTPPFSKKPPSSYHHHHLLPPSSMTSPLHHHHHRHNFNHHNYIAMTSSSLSLTLQRFLSSSSPSSSSSPNQSDPNPNPNSTSEMKHQEIEGPTVERDLSPLATESREVTTSLLKTMYNLTKLLAVLGLSHLCLGTYTYALASSSSSSPLLIQMSVTSAIAFGFPFSMAFLLRQSLKHMHFFQKMEQIGRLQILTSTMQISKHLLLFFFRLRAVSYLCVAGLSFSFLYSLYSSLN